MLSRNLYSRDLFFLHLHKYFFDGKLCFLGSRSVLWYIVEEIKVFWLIYKFWRFYEINIIFYVVEMTLNAEKSIKCIIIKKYP